MVKCQKSKKELEWNELGLFWHRLFTTKNEVDLLHLKVDTRKIVPKRCFHLFAALNLILLDKISFAHKWVLCKLFRSQKWWYRICNHLLLLFLSCYNKQSMHYPFVATQGSLTKFLLYPNWVVSVIYGPCHYSLHGCKVILNQHTFLKNGPTPASFSFIFVFSNKHYNSYNK